MKRIFNFSGGKTSAYMVLKYAKSDDLVIFCDTGREHPLTYKFIDDFEKNENIPIIRLKYYDSDDPFKFMLEKRKYKVIPNRVKRMCTVELKIKTCRRYLRSLGLISYENFIGFRSDEEIRVKRNKSSWKKVTNKFPLFEDGIDKMIINDFWSKKSYNLEIPSILGNCTLCFMKGQNAIISILSQFPELADQWIEDEKLSANLNGSGKGHQYFPDVTIEQLKIIAQNNLFKNEKFDLKNIKPAFNCACTT